MSSTAEGNNVITLVDGQGLRGPDGIAVDAKNEKMYWTNMAAGTPNGFLQRSNLDGSNYEFKSGETRTSRTDIEMLMENITMPIKPALSLCSFPIFYLSFKLVSL